MKKALAFKAFIIVVAIIQDKAVFGSSMSGPTDSAGIARTKRIDSLLKVNNMIVDQWSLYPTYSKTWVNGARKNESYLVAEFTNLDDKKPLTEQQMNTFSQQLYATVAADLEPVNSFDGLRIQFENREDYMLFASTQKYSLTYLFNEPEQTVAAN